MSHDPSDLVLTVVNAHHASCGKPPGLIQTGDKYVGYFEGPHGEQFVCQWDPDYDEYIVLRGGDINWDKPVLIKAPDAAPHYPAALEAAIEHFRRNVPPMLLSAIERHWLISCIALVAIQKNRHSYRTKKEEKNT